MAQLTERQASILRFIERHCSDSGYPPTVREIGRAVGLASPSTVHAHLAKLEAAGRIRRDPTKPRAMLVCVAEAPDPPAPSPSPVPAPPHMSLPLVGSVAAGAPRLAEEHVEDWIATPFAGDFLLRVTGESMTDAGILDGDLVVVRRQQTADDGEIVVACVEDEATVKRLRRSGGRIVLQPENAAYEPIVVDEVAILGKVVGVMRAM